MIIIMIMRIIIAIKIIIWISNVMWRTSAVVESAHAHRLSSISENITNLACAGRMNCKVRQDFKIISHELSRVLRVLLVTSNIMESSISSSKSLYKKTSQEILAELKAGFKTGVSKVLETPTHPTLPVTTQLSGACQQPAITDTCRRHQEERRGRT